MRRLFILMVMAGLIALLGPAVSGTPQDERENELSSFEKARFVEKFVAQLKHQKPLAPLLRTDITFIYHSDNRCEGNTDGLIPKLSATHIDSPFTLEVTNDGDAWNCEKKAASTFEIEFDLQARLASWERLEAIPESGSPNAFIVEGRGQSDYMVVHLEVIAKEIAIFKLEYRSEDPG